MFWRTMFWSTIMVTLIGQTGRPTLAADDEVPKTLGWQGYLAFAGRKCDLQFTIERVANADEPDAELEAVADFPSAADFIKNVAPRLDWLSFTLDENHKRVIHVIDKRLLALKNYALEKVVDVEFAGVPANLGWYLNRQVPNLEPKRSGDSRQIFDDHFTEVALAAKAHRVRRVLTDAVPLSCYKSILWRTETDITDADSTTVVQFYGSKAIAGGHVWPWWSWLEVASESLGCTFTVETIYRAPDNPLSCPPFFSRDEKFEDVDSMIRELTKRAPNLTAIKNSKRPEIVHILDKELLKVREYALERQLTIDYQGSPDGLIATLKENGIGAGLKISEATQKPAEGSDKKTPITVHVKDGQVRTILTDGFQTTKAKPGVLWHARTWVKADGPQTAVEFRQPK